MSAKKIEDYLSEDQYKLIALIAFKVDDICDVKFPEINQHLKQLNNRVDKNDRRLYKMEARAEVEERYGLVKIPMTKKKMIAVGGGSLTVVIALLYLLPEVIDWLKGLL